MLSEIIDKKIDMSPNGYDYPLSSIMKREITFLRNNFMPGYLLPVSDADKAVVRPVVLQVCRALQTHLNLGRHTEMIYAGDTLAIPQNGSNLSDKNDLP
ncbi:hypothetical protein [Vibrio parahaemolyticus]|uniref:hypothetical protein n=2 Tax=Vibrionaceae TaxID=641 RepID=UPI00215BEECD|nr:hypothetical protein [Vibrio parahaemolyticus]MCR9731401.1 hypothetical protein [Vibrio parahaemolyticus]MCR9750400.1 hypothetical protein [Vibrio parahaemolyticus]MCR9786994.1 hypothetical protein [Vibrio parahaemolyticus]MCR9859720.1 hypothetical protein [Vibrio parahaemolyticus]